MTGLDPAADGGTAASIRVRAGHEVLLAEALGHNAIRLRLGRHRIRPGGNGAFAEISPTGSGMTSLIDPTGPPGLTRSTGLADPAGPPEPETVLRAGQRCQLTCGQLRLEVWQEMAGWEPGLGLSFTDTKDDATLLSEHRIHFSWPAGHLLEGRGDGSYKLVQEFIAAPAERFYGLGGHPSGHLSLNDQAFDLVQRNGEVCLPVVISSRGYGFIWNHPGTGRAEFTAETVRWTADQAIQLDYVVFCGDSPADLLRTYADLTGYAPVMPAWALGLWQSNLRYTHQDEILAVAQEYHRRGLPLSVVVSDAGHWTAMGDFGFDPAEYPDPAGLISQLHELGCELMVSVWPTVSPLAASYPAWREAGLLVAAEQGGAFPTMMFDKPASQPIPLALIDATNPAARTALWDALEAAYRAVGVKMFWLDADEPERLPGNSRNLSFWAGPGEQMVNRYPFDHARALAEGAPDVLLLSRSAWLGQQSLGCAVWSGDIPATWDSLARQVKVGLQMALSGLPWWTSDIGGFFGGDPSDPDYRELFVRWFQYGVYCPLLRVHGIREPRRQADVGGPNEIWAFGDQAYGILVEALRRRQALRPYLADLARQTSLTGLPPMRPLLVDFPDDPTAWLTEDQFMLGDRYLVAPVTRPGARQREVYLPNGGRWVWQGQELAGGQHYTLEAPLESIPVVERADRS